MPLDFYINVGLADVLSSFLVIFPPGGIGEFSAEFGQLGNSSTLTGTSDLGEDRPELSKAS